LTWKQFKKRANISFPFLLRNFRIFSSQLLNPETHHTLVHENFTHPFTNFQSFSDLDENSSSGSFSNSESIAPIIGLLYLVKFSSWVRGFWRLWWEAQVETMTLELCLLHWFPYIFFQMEWQILIHMGILNVILNKLVS
jgi:hypothetical protein